MYNPLSKTRLANLGAIVGIFIATCWTSSAADITWNLPIPIADDTDVITSGSLDRAYVMGYGADRVTVNGVTFTRFGKNQIQNQGNESVTEDQTVLAIGGDDDGIMADTRHYGRDFVGLSASYQALLNSGVYNRGAPWALILNGLVVGKTYYFQSWMCDPLTPKTAQTITGGTNSIQIDAPLGGSIIGTFVADNVNQAIVFSPNRGSAQMNAFQLRAADDVQAPVSIIKQPQPATAHLGESASLSVFAVGHPAPTYQWQKITGNKAEKLTDGDTFSGSKTSTLNLHRITPALAGDYRVLTMNSFGSITSQVATVTIVTNPLINFAVGGVNPVVYKGMAILSGNADDVWNSADARDSFTNAPLVDSAGESTPVTLTLTKSDGSAVPHPLLGGISYAATQTVTLKNLVPDQFYDLVVFSVGSQPNEGGVFSGAISGLTRGYPAPDTIPTDFLPGTNYVKNPFARTDAHGTLTFTIKPNATAMSGGYFNCDFNGLQLIRSSQQSSTPIILQQPSSVTANMHQSIVLTAIAANPSATSYQWRKVTPLGISNLFDTDNITGTSSNTLTLARLAANDNGGYQVVVSGSSGAVTSSVAMVTVLTNQLINMAVTDGRPTLYKGLAVLPGTPNDAWNGVDARNSFDDIPLIDSTGHSTPVTLALDKNSDAEFPHTLLGGVSVATRQIVTIRHLQPHEFYDLVVFSVGGQAHEGGVFSGALNGIAQGYPVPDFPLNNFLLNTNYVENPYACSDEQGTISFTINPNATVMPQGYFNGDFNGLQLLKTSLDNHAPAITEQPASIKVYLRHPLILGVTAAASPTSPATFQWQKITTKGITDLVDDEHVSGSRMSTLKFQSVSFNDAGNYRMVAMNSFGSVTSRVATVTVATNPLINVAVYPGDRRELHYGMAVLSGTTNDTWNGIDARGSFTNAPLLDAAGVATPVTLTLTKSEGDAVPHPLLGGISYATNQVVTISHLLPGEFYDLVVFSVGSQPNEGGVFSGAITGVAQGYPQQGMMPTDFSPGINYVENPAARSDAHGTLTFTIHPTASTMPGGYFNGDFNGLQLMEGLRVTHVSETNKTH